ncbi:MAG: hypothetical protein Q8K32_13565 [Archangium sp.]|nr:hypothetical protein [Archangium sp.]
MTWAEARKVTAAILEGMTMVRGLGHTLKAAGRTVTRMPRFMLHTLIWLLSRTAGVRDLGEFGPSEPRAMIDAMTLAAPGQTQQLLAIRP